MADAAIGARPAHKAATWFYAWMALACLAVALVGFLPTYFVPLAQGTFVAPPIVHIHGAMFYAWTIFFVSQTWLVASGRTIAHREWGMLGVAIATAMVFLVFATASVMMNFRAAHGFAEQGLVFSWVQASGMLFFGAAVALAIVNVKKSEIHKRLMLLATISLLDAPIARWFMVLAGPPPPLGAAPPVAAVIPAALSADVLLIVAILFDWRTRGRPHPVYLIGGAVLLLMQATRAPISEAAAWHAVAVWLAGLGG